MRKKRVSTNTPIELNLPTNFLSIDEEGYLLSGEARLNDPDFGAQILNNLRFAANGALVSEAAGSSCIIEAFDEPLVARMISKQQDTLVLEFPYGVKKKLLFETLTLDEWDRFHGRTTEDIPFVLSRPAQNEFFNLLSEFDDDSVTYNDKTYKIPSYYKEFNELDGENFWSEIYRTETPRWDLKQPTPALVDMLPRLKLTKQRILVLGGGAGHDAAFIAQAGHSVTLVDISSEAVTQAQSLYGSIENLKILQADAFNLPKSFAGNFDIVFEHTFFCAVNPSRRNELINIWRNCLTEQGQVLGIFFVMDKKERAPIGSSEWELRQRFKKHFHFLFWGRWHESIDKRQGLELFVYMQKKSL